jgi:hypothetical protein
MATTITIKNSSVAGKVPDVDSIQVAELALNLADKKLYSKNASDEVFEVNSVVNSGDTLPGSGTNPGDLFWDTDDETLYYWDGTQWQAIASGSAVEGEYLKLTGGDLTGDLTLNTDKITLDATAGSITAAGKVESGFDNNTSEGVRLDPAGIVNVRRDSETSTAIGVFSGGVASSSTQTVEITAGGSITAAGNITTPRILAIGPTASDKVWSGYLTDTTGAATSFINADGSAIFAGPLTVYDALAGSATDSSFTIRNPDNTADVASINGNGSATFAGRVDAGDPALDNAAIVASGKHATKGVIQAYHYNNGSIFLGGGSDGVTKAEIKANGSAELAGSITAAGGIGASNFEARRTGTNLDVFSGFQNSTDLTSQILADGSAEFARGIWIAKDAKDGYLNVTQSTTGAAAFNVIDNAGTSTAVIYGSGSAEFAGRAAVGAEDLNNYALVAKNEALNPTIYARNYEDDSRALVFGGYNSGSSTVPTSSIFASGSAEFAGGAVLVESSGTIRTAASGTGFTLGTTLPTSDSTNSAFEIKAGATANTPDTGTGTVKITPSGSASFAGDVDIRSLEAGNPVHDAVAGVNTSSFRRSHSGLNLDCLVRLPLVSDSASPTGQSVITASNKGTQVFNVGTDGSAIFNSTVTTGSYVAANKDGIRKGASSTFISYGDSGLAGGATAYISADGSATFSSKVKTTGWFESARPSTSGIVFQGIGGSSTTSTINANGSASFSGTVTAGGYSMASLAQL